MTRQAMKLLAGFGDLGFPAHGLDVPIFSCIKGPERTRGGHQVIKSRRGFQATRGCHRADDDPQLQERCPRHMQQLAKLDNDDLIGPMLPPLFLLARVLHTCPTRKVLF